MSSVPAIVAPIEHIVLIKVRPEADACVMVSSLQALSTLVPEVSYLYAGPVLRLRSPAAVALGATHIVHSRHATKEDLAAYVNHPAHVAAVQEHVLPNALDTTVVDWANLVTLPSPIAPGVAMRLTLAKIKEGEEIGVLVEKVTAATTVAAEAMGVTVSFGENFSPSMTKEYYPFGMVGVYGNLEKLNLVEGNGKVAEARAAFMGMIADMLVLDFIVGDASL